MIKSLFITCKNIYQNKNNFNSYKIEIIFYVEEKRGTDYAINATFGIIQYIICEYSIHAFENNEIFMELSETTGDDRSHFIPSVCTNRITY